MSKRGNKMDNKKINIVTFHAQQISKGGVMCGLSFTDEFMAIDDDDMKTALVMAVHETLTDFIQQNSMADDDADADPIKDADDFLESCVKAQGGRLH